MKKKEMFVAMVILFISLTGNLYGGGGNKGKSQPSGSGEWAPTKEFTFINPFKAGGNSDVPARIVAKYMSKYSAKKVNVINIEGAGGTIAFRETMKADPDGFTFAMGFPGLAMHYALGGVEFTYEDFDPIAHYLDSFLVLVVREGEYADFKALIDAARAAPGEVVLGAVTGTAPLLAEMKIELHEGVDFKLVDLANGVKAPELIGGRIEGYVDGFGAVKKFIDAGQFKVLAAFANERIPGYDDIPTFIEMGYEGTEFLAQSYGLWAPKGTPPEALAYVENLVRQAYEDPECVEELAKLAYTMAFTPREAYIQDLEKVYAQFAEFAALLEN